MGGAGPFSAPGKPINLILNPDQFFAQFTVDPVVHQWFTAVDQDRSGQICATELQQALTNSDWSRFNPETCRLMIR
jgi:hypothetical protein